LHCFLRIYKQLKTITMSKWDTFYRNETKVVYNGVEMTLAEANKLKKKEEKKKKIKAKNDKIIPLLPDYIKSFTKNLKLCKSLTAYKNNGYRQWGTIVLDVLNNPLISTPFAKFSTAVTEMNKNLTLIEKIAKRNDKDVFGIIEKLHWAIDDAHNALDDLTDGITKSGVLTEPLYKGKEFIYGNGRRLGLKELCSRTSVTMMLMQNTINELKKIVDNSMDMVTYDINKHTCCYSEKGMVKH